MPRVKLCVILPRKKITAEMHLGVPGAWDSVGKGAAPSCTGVVVWYQGGGPLLRGRGIPGCAASRGNHGGDVQSSGFVVRAVVPVWWKLASRMSYLADSGKLVS